MRFCRQTCVNAYDGPFFSKTIGTLGEITTLYCSTTEAASNDMERALSGGEQFTLASDSFILIVLII